MLITGRRFHNPCAHLSSFHNAFFESTSYFNFGLIRFLIKSCVKKTQAKWPSIIPFERMSVCSMILKLSVTASITINKLFLEKFMLRWQKVERKFKRLNFHTSVPWCNSLSHLWIKPLFCLKKEKKERKGLPFYYYYYYFTHVISNYPNSKGEVKYTSAIGPSWKSAN